jgi:hypothetical protein
VSVEPLPKPAPPRAWLSAAAPALALVLLAAIFFRASNAPIWHLDTWAHWKFGQWICEHRRLPNRDPFSLYSDPSHPLMDSLWLSQVSCYLVYARLGMEGIALAYALVELARAALYLMALRRVSGSLWLAILGLVLFQAGRWIYFGVFRPQTFAEAFWAALLLACARPTLSRATLVWMPGVMLLWANVHGSFLLGLALLGVVVAGRLVEQARQCGSLAAAAADGNIRSWLLLFGLCLAATCVNPYGPRLLVEVARFGNQPILQYVKEWLPLAPLTTYESRVLVASFVAVLVTLRLSPRRFDSADAVLLLLFGLAAWFSARMVPWWMSLWPFVLLPHWQALLEKVRRQPVAHGVPSSLVQRAFWGVGIVAALALFVGSATGQWLLHREPRPVEKQTTDSTPVRASAELKAWIERNPSAGPRRVFESVYWSDYLVWDLPPTATVFWYSHWDHFTPQLMGDGSRLLALSESPPSWRTVLARYRINTLALKGDDLSRPLREYILSPQGCAEWEVIYRDDSPAGGLVAVRRVDPFVLSLAGAQAAQGCVGAIGEPLAGRWDFLAELPWCWPER